MSQGVRARVRDDIVRLAHRDLDLPQLTEAVVRRLTTAVPFEGACLLTVDPATLLPTEEVVVDALPASVRPRMTEIELREPDVNKFTHLAHSTIPAASLSAVTAGDLDLSRRHRELRRPCGFADELRAVLASPTGCWGALTLLRENGRPSFTTPDVKFIASLAPVLADALRRVTLSTRTATPDRDPSETGFLVVAPDDSVEIINDDAQRWIDELTVTDAARLPIAVSAVIAQTRQVSANSATLATARVHTRSGIWLVVRGSVLDNDRVGVLLEAARPVELATVVADTYVLTDRERTIAALVAQGHTTNDIADRLHLSAYTVQDHLKAIFDKTGTGSRGELVARLFLDHHIPQLQAKPSKAG